MNMPTRFIYQVLPLVLLVAVAAASRGDAQERQRRQRQRPGVRQAPVVPEGVKLSKDLAYREGNRAWKLDLAIPESPAETPRPAIVFVHGGGWRSGDKQRGYFFEGALEYAKKGYVCVTVNYRMNPDFTVTQCIEDVKCSVRWLRANAEKYNIDPKRIGAFGNSAGAHLVSMLGLAGPDAGLEGDGPYQDQSSMVQAVCASATPADFMNWIRQGEPIRAYEQRFGKSGDEGLALAENASPITHVSADAPPFLLFHGTSDRTVPFRQGKSFSEALKKAGAEDVTLEVYDGAGHGVFNGNSEDTHTKLERFFERTLKDAAKIK